MKIAIYAVLALSVWTAPSVAFVPNGDNASSVEATEVMFDGLPMNGGLNLVDEVSMSIIPDGVDEIVTGDKVSAEELGIYRKRRQEFIKCPSCAMNQPFPFD